jgi:ABC-type branched-subunit amino acid transport system ATPase component
MTVGDNVRVGYEARLAGHNPWRQLIAPRRAGSATDVAVAAALKRCGLDALERSPVGVLSTGRRRLVELARVVAGGFRFLLLDEPSSGLDDAETEQFAVIVRSVVEDLGVGVLLVEHDMPLVMGLCDQIHVIDFGRHLFAGAPHEVASSAVVRAAYLGTDVGELS